MSQLGLFSPKPKAASWFEAFDDEGPVFDSVPPPAPGAALMTRWYQDEAIAGVHEQLRTNRSTLMVMATGLGKTVAFGHLARSWQDGSVLVLAHREELVEQARRSIEAITGEYVEIEKAERQSTGNARIVVGSVQSFNQVRMDRLGKDRFGLIITDEAHHYIAPTFRRPLDFFSNAKVVGVTATPDRGDERAMAQVFESVAYLMGIEDGIEHGYLVPIIAETVAVKELQLDNVAVQGGDFVQGQLDEATLKAIEGIVKGTLEHGGERPGLVFFPGIKSSMAAAERFNALAPMSAVHVSGQTPENERRMIMGDFKAGRYRYLCNCNIATEGFDAPHASLVVMGRPTKSRALAAQMIGRGTRTLPKVVDHLTGRDDGPARRLAISQSGKPDCLVLDFVGNSSHTLALAEDVLGGNYTEPEIALAKKKRTSGGGNIADALAAAREELRQLAKSTSSRVTTEKARFDPFGTLKLNTRFIDQKELRFGSEPMTPKQFGFLRYEGIDRSELKEMSKAKASALITKVMERRQKGLCPLRQLKELQGYGVTESSIDEVTAARALDYIRSAKHHGGKVDAATLNSILYPDASKMQKPLKPPTRNRGWEDT